MSGWRTLLLPFSLLYGLVTIVRNWLYDKRLLPSYSSPLPTIGVGNLTTGGTGKTPHIEYLVRLLRPHYRVATLSRGYGRKTKGFMIVSNPSGTDMIGDEPMQYYSKFSDILVSVGEDRAAALQRLERHHPKPQVVLLDDVFQHRAVRPGHQILLIEYDRIMQTELLLPAGDLREVKSGQRRADTIIITKSPAILVPIERKRILENLQPLEHQQVFFTYYRYGDFTRLHAKPGGMMMGSQYYLEKRFTILMVTGIAHPATLIEHLRRQSDKLEMMLFPDHHEFTEKDIRRIQETFDQIANPNKILVTTEKDAMRFRNPRIDVLTRNMPIFYIPIEVAFHQDGEKFDQTITRYVTAARKPS